MNLYTAEKNNNNSTGVSYTSGFFMLIGIALIMVFVSSQLLLAFIGTDPAALKDPANAGKLRLVQVVHIAVGFFLPAVIVASILNRRPFQLLGFRKDVSWKQLGLTLLIAFVSIYLAGSLGVLNREIPVSPEWKLQFERLEKEYMEQVALMISTDGMGGYLLSIFIMALMPAVCEEVLFRGGLQNFLTRATRRPWLSILIVSLLFSLVHISFYGFLPRLYLGIMLGLIFHYTGNIWLAIAAHFFNNALAVTVVFVSLKQGISLEKALNEDFSMAYWGLITLPVVVLFFSLLKKSVAAQPKTSDRDGI